VVLLLLSLRQAQFLLSSPDFGDVARRYGIYGKKDRLKVNTDVIGA
jgi:hypothetical protein